MFTSFSNDNYNFGRPSLGGSIGRPSRSSGAATKQTFSCATCGITCNSEMNLMQHMEGAKHKQKMLQNGNGGWGQKPQSAAANTSPFVPSKGVFSSNDVSFTPVKKIDTPAVKFTPSFAAPKKACASFDFQPKKECNFLFGSTATNFPVAESKGIFSFESATNGVKGSSSFCSDSKPHIPSPFHPKKENNAAPFLFSQQETLPPEVDNASRVQDKMTSFCFTATGTNNSPKHAKESHKNVTCDVCGMFPLIGVRYRCSMCANYDLCESCVDATEHNKSPMHDPSHLFLRIAKHDPKYDLYPVVVNRCNAVHKGIVCDGCSTKDIQGYRYQCQLCPDLDFCEACEAKGVHDTSHPRIKMSVPRSNTIN